MRESRTSGSVREASSDRRLYSTLLPPQRSRDLEVQDRASLGANPQKRRSWMACQSPLWKRKQSGLSADRSSEKCQIRTLAARSEADLRVQLAPRSRSRSLADGRHEEKADVPDQARRNGRHGLIDDSGNTVVMKVARGLDFE
jgi:hypothetical protein